MGIFTAITFVVFIYLFGFSKSDGPVLAVFPSFSVKNHGDCSVHNLKTFNHLALDRSSNKIYIGGVNRIIQLDSLLNLESCIVTGPKKDSYQCHASGCSSSDIETSLMDNVNKILLLDTESGSVIACGSLFQGACEKYRLSNISSVSSQFIPISIAANDEHSSTYAFIGPERYSPWHQSNVLYVGTTFTNNGEYRYDVPAISSRNLFTLDIAENSFSKQSLLKIDVKYRDHFLVKYVYGFNYSDFAYFVVVQKQSYLPGQEELGYASRLARVCISDANYDSYTEVTLQCTSKSANDKEKIINYTLVQDVKISTSGEDLASSLGIKLGDSILVASFSPSRSISNEPLSQSALCIYSMKDIEAKFNENIHMCFNGSISNRNMLYISGSISNGDCPVAGSTGNIFNFCEVGLKISGSVPISTKTAIIFNNKLVTSVTITTTERSTVAFLGTSDGVLKKVLLTSYFEGIEYEEITLDNGNAILPDSTLSPIGDYIYVLITTKVMKVRMENCAKYSNCSSCLEAKDPYCGWCSLEKRCTVRSACQQASQSLPRWLFFGAGQQCIDFEQVSPDRIAINQMTTVHLTIRTLPELPSGAKYRCIFGGSEPIDATVIPSGLKCSTPSISSRPKIPDGQDHVFVPLSVRSTETNKDFVSRNFAYFDCGWHKKCVDCVKSNWACNWCVYDNKCTHNTSTCNRNIISGEKNPMKLLLHGPNACPRFHRPVESILLPNGVYNSIVLKVENMPQPLPAHTGFKCIVNLDDARMMIPAKVENEKSIVCEKTLYSYRAHKGEFEASVTIVWNHSHHVDTINVTLYKCEILGSHREHPDCSLCITRNAKYHCTWCSNACTHRELCSLPYSSECPKPRIDVIKPLSGPMEGGTLITIEGSNLGLKEEDVKNKIYIGDSLCALVEYQVSVKIVCRTGYSAVKKTAPISIGNSAGFTESSVFFSYENVMLSAVTPSVGPISGGTQLAITGNHLNIGSHTKTFLDDLPCYVNLTQATSTRITCVTSRVAGPRKIHSLALIIDGANRTLTGYPFTYKMDPTIAELKPLMSFISGGRMIIVHGTNFDTIQKPEMVVYVDSDFDFPVNKTVCTVLNPTQMECPSPAVNFQFTKMLTLQNSPAVQQISDVNKNNDLQRLVLKIGFNMDNVESVKDLEKHYKDLPSSIVYVEDPNFYRFPNEEKSYKGDNLVIEGENLNSACDESDVMVTIGTVQCNITSLASTHLVCVPPQSQPPPTDDLDKLTVFGLPMVVVHVGKNLRYNIGYIRYEIATSYSFPSEVFVGIVVIILILVMLFISLTFLRRKSTQAEREYKRIQIQMDTLESNIRLECKQAFAELQTDMTDLTADLESSGIPTLNHTDYILKVFFPGVKEHPVLTDLKIRMNCPPTNYDAAMLQFEQLINNKYFILTFIETLESQKSFDIRDRVNVASLLMIVIMDKMDYVTDVLRCLLLRLIDKSIASKHPQLMLRRTESVVEKMLTNWLALCMYKYLKDYAGSSLFLLYKAVKHQIEKGPVDTITHEARYSLSEERLLREQIEHKVVVLHVLQDDLDEKIQCKVLDCDTISQVKSKILDALYKNTPFSLRPSVNDVDLEWRHGRGGHLVLRDEDITSKTVCGWRKLNTLAHYGIRDSAVMSLILKSSETYALNNCKQTSCHNNFAALTPNNSTIYFTNSLSSAITNNGGLEAANVHYYHLVKPISEHQYYSTKTMERTLKAIPEIYLTRLLSTKGTVQKFVDDFFNTILTANEALPPAVKWLYDLFDEACKTHNITDPEVLHAWKSNSLPLRFWVNFIKNPDFIFDINKTPTVDSCLSVIAQTFMDSCSMIDRRIGKDSPSNKLLFAKDILQYREMVSRFYYDIKLMPQVSDQELNTAMQQLSVSHVGHFLTISALKELYIYVSKYNEQILKSLESNPYCQGTHLSHKLESVACVLEGEGTYASIPV